MSAPSTSTGVPAAKYKALKRKLADTLERFEETRLALAASKKKIRKLKKANFLMDERLRVYEGSESESDSDDLSSDSSMGLVPRRKVRATDARSGDLSPSLNETNGAVVPARSGTFSKSKRSQMQTPPSALQPSPIIHGNGSALGAEPKPKKKTKKDAPIEYMGDVSPPLAVENPDLPEIKHAKIPRGPDGKPVLPLAIGVVTVYSLGEVVWDRQKFHSERYIYPVGYEAKRPYASMKDASSGTIYTSRIRDGGDKPLFEVFAEDDPEHIISHETASGAWSEVLRTTNQVRNLVAAASASGPELFGLSQPVISRLIQELPNARRCSKYQWRKFVEDSSRIIKVTVHPPQGSIASGTKYPRERKSGGKKKNGDAVAGTPTGVSQGSGTITPSGYERGYQSMQMNPGGVPVSVSSMMMSSNGGPGPMVSNGNGNNEGPGESDGEGEEEEMGTDERDEMEGMSQQHHVRQPGSTPSASMLGLAGGYPPPPNAGGHLSSHGMGYNPGPGGYVPAPPPNPLPSSSVSAGPMYADPYQHRVHAPYYPHHHHPNEYMAPPAPPPPGHGYVSHHGHRMHPSDPEMKY